MQIEPKAIYANLKNWDFETLGPYKLKEEEAIAIMELYEEKEHMGKSIKTLEEMIWKKL